MKNTVFLTLILSIFASNSWAIRNGEAIKHKNNNFMVFVLSGDNHCSGIRIDKDYILTVAHCFPSKSSAILTWYEDGKRKNSRASYRDIKFLGTVLSRELALVPIKGGGDFQSLDIFDYRLLKYDSTEKYEFFGLGLSTNSSFPGVLRKGAMNFKQEIEYGDNKDPLLEFSRNRTQGQNPCLGDSGGPILKKVDQEYKLLGLVSFVDSKNHKIHAGLDPKYICEVADMAFYIPISEYYDELKALMIP